MNTCSVATRPDWIAVHVVSCRPISPSWSIRRKMPSFPEPAWFLALGRLMEAEGPLFQRLGFAETRFVVRILPDAEGNGGETLIGLVIDGYRLASAAQITGIDAFDPDFVICGKRSVWNQML